jgi:hypothetical protein
MSTLPREGYLIVKSGYISLFINKLYLYYYLTSSIASKDKAITLL